MVQSDLLKLGAIRTGYTLVQKFLAKLTASAALSAGAATITFARGFNSSVLLSTGLYGDTANNVAAFTFDTATQATRMKMRGSQVNNLIIGASSTAHRDLTQTEWVKTNATAAKTQTGVDGTANAASSITATADAATCFFTITTSGTRTFSAFVKRLAGGGRIAITRDGGTTYNDITASCVIGSWTRISLTTTQTNPVVGFWMEKSGASIATDAVNDTDTAIMYDPCIARVQDRRADALSYTSILPAIQPACRYYMSAEIVIQGTVATSLWLSNSNNDQFFISLNPSTSFVSCFQRLTNVLKVNNTTANQTARTYMPVGTRLKFGLLFGISQMSTYVNDVLQYTWDGSLAASGTTLTEPLALNSLAIAADGDVTNVQINEVIGNNLMLVGDSITSLSDYTDLFRNTLNSFEWTVFGRGTGGNVITDVTARLSTDVTPYYWAKANRNVLFLWIGTNTLANNVSAATALTQLQALVTAILAAQPGWRIKLITTIPSRSAGLTGITAANFTIQANLYNAGMTGISGVDGVIDITGVTEALDSTNTAYFSDGIHPTTVLYGLMKKIFISNIY